MQLSKQLALGGIATAAVIGGGIDLAGRAQRHAQIASVPGWVDDGATQQINKAMNRAHRLENISLVPVGVLAAASGALAFTHGKAAIAAGVIAAAALGASAITAFRADRAFDTAEALEKEVGSKGADIGRLTTYLMEKGDGEGDGVIDHSEAKGNPDDPFIHWEEAPPSQWADYVRTNLLGMNPDEQSGRWPTESAGDRPEKLDAPALEQELREMDADHDGRLTLKESFGFGVFGPGWGAAQ